MAAELHIRPVDFITIGTIGPKGDRTFYLQSGNDENIVTFTIEKVHADALNEAAVQLLDSAYEANDRDTDVELVSMDMELREPILPMFRIGGLQLAYDVAEDMCVVSVSRFSISDPADDVEGDEIRTVHMWCSRSELLALALIAEETVEAGRPDAELNGRITYYWRA